MKARMQTIWNGIQDTTLLLTLFLWLCALPFILLLTVPFFGWHVGILAAAIALFVGLVICHALCYFPKIAPREEEKTNVKGPSLR